MERKMENCKICGKKIKKKDLITVTDYYAGDKVVVNHYCIDHRPWDDNKNILFKGTIKIAQKEEKK